MSYSQIFRRINRILKGTIHDALDGLTGHERELHDFDEELKQSAGAQRASSANAGQTSGDGAGARAQSDAGGQQRREHASEGKRKPGEKDDAHYYAVLGLTPDAGVELIKKTYRKLMSQVHPDRVVALGPDRQKAALERAQAINEAYHIIERRRGFK
jgi:DnaJ-domain-containing protein 1